MQGFALWSVALISAQSNFPLSNIASYLRHSLTHSLSAQVLRDQPPFS